MMEHYLNGKRVFLYTLCGHEGVEWYAHERLMNEMELLSLLVAAFTRGAEELDRWEWRFQIGLDLNLDPYSEEGQRLRSEHWELERGTKALRDAGFVPLEAQSGVFAPEHQDVRKKLATLKQRLDEL